MVEFLNDFVPIKTVCINYFAPYHAKNDCDCHFGCISYWMEYYSKKWKNGIQNTPDICRAIIEGTRSAEKNNNRRKSKRTQNRIATTTVIDFDIDTQDKYYIDPLIQYYELNID